MKTSPILAALALTLTATLASAEPAAPASPATTTATTAAAATAVAQNTAAAPLRSAQPAQPHELTRAEVRAETAAWLRAHPNRVAEEYQPFEHH